MAQIECKNLTCGYDNKPVVKNLSFSVNAGDYVSIVGENGAGKSTLIKTILGLIPVQSGSLKFGDGLKRNEIGYLPQQTVVQKDFPATVMEVVLSGFQNRHKFIPFYTKKEINIAKENLKRLSISNLAKKCYRELSGGQQQRVLLARALCATGKVILLDEPVSGLDPVAAHDLYDVIKHLNSEGITIIMISHDVSTVMKYASHVLFMGEPIIFQTKESFEKSDIGKHFKHFVGGCPHEHNI